MNMTVTAHQQIFAGTAASSLIILILWLVYKRRIKERYAWLWLLTGLIILALVLFYKLLLFISSLIGAVSPQTTLFIFGLFFLILINIHFSIRISTMSDQIKELTQELSILKKENSEK